MDSTGTNRRYLQWLYGELPKWVQEGIVSNDTQERLLARYGPVETTSRSRMALLIFSILGASLIGLGIILLIAHNWDELSRIARTVIAFAPLVLGQALSVWVLWKKNSSTAWREGSATFLTAAIGACLALISQTYHVVGDLRDYVQTWMLLSLPVIYLLRAVVPASLYLIGAAFWAVDFGFINNHSLGYFLLLAAILPYAAVMFHLNKRGFEVPLLSWIFCITLALAACFLYGNSAPGVIKAALASLFALLYLISQMRGEEPFRYQKAFHAVGYLGAAILALSLTARIFWTPIPAESLVHPHWAASATQDYVSAGVLLALAILAFVAPSPKRAPIAGILAILPIITVLLVILQRTTEMPAVIPIAVYNLYALGLGLLTLYQGIQARHLLQLNTGLLVLTALTLMRFFDADLDFVLRGVLFILAGIAFILVNALVLSRKPPSAEAAS